MLKLYENIKNLRIENGWTQDYLAKKVGYADKTMISRIESGLIDLKQSQIRKMADAFGVSPADLFGSSSDRFDLSVFEMELVRAYRSAPESRREAVRALLEIKEKEAASAVS